MDLTADQRANVINVLRTAGFSKAWTLNNVDSYELILLVPEDEGDVRAIVQSASTRAVVESIMEILPFSRTYIVKHSEGMDVSRFY